MKNLIYLLISLVLFFSCAKNEKGVDYTNIGKDEREELVGNLEKKAKSLYEQNLYGETIELYQKLISIDSLNGLYYFRVGYSQAQLNLHQESVLNYEKSAELGFEEYDCYFSLGAIYGVVLGDKKKAIQNLKKALQIKPDSEEVKSMLESITESENEILL